MERLFNFLTSVDFTPAFVLMVFINVFLCIIWMQASLRDPVLVFLPSWQLHGRRVGLAVMAMGWLWMASFGDSMKWTIWPPVLLILLGQNVYFAVSVAAIWRRAHDSAIRQNKSTGIMAGL